LDHVLKKVFLSCVSAQFAKQRATLKAQFLKAGIALCVQEDFADAASARGALVKLFRYIERSDLVVQLIGGVQGDCVRYPIVDELLQIEPKLKAWLIEKGLYIDLHDGRMSYTDFESYLAIYLRKGFLPIRVANGSQYEHEQRLRKLGRHVNVSIQKVEGLLAEVEQVLHQDPKELRAPEPVAPKSNAWIIGCVFALAASLLLQFAATWHAVNPPNFQQAVVELGLWLMCWFVPFGLHIAIMSDNLNFRFRVTTALRNTSVIVLIASAIGCALASIDSLFDWMQNSWMNFLLVATLASSTNLLHEPFRKNKSLGQLVAFVALGVAQWWLLLWLLNWLGWRTDALYWVMIAAAWVLVGSVVYRENTLFMRWYEYNSSDFTDNVTAWEDQYFWTPRDEVVANLNSNSFRTISPRPTAIKKAEK
jgi:hypothetical protein